MHLSALRILLILSFVLPAGCDSGPSGGEAGDVKELDWNALVRTDWTPEKLMEQHGFSSLSEIEHAATPPISNLKARALLEKIKRLRDEASVVKSLNGQQVKLSGFVVPLEMNAQSINEFLLVPYYGACIHVPPPPTNQTVHVIAPADKPFEGKLFDTVRVIGEMKVERYSNEMGNAGYSIHASKIESYE